MTEDARQPSPDCLPLIFLHMFKAGGTSLRKFIRDQYPRSHAVEVNGSIADLQAWQSRDERERHDVDLLLGHQYFGNHTFLREGASYITVLRDPIERVVSFYYYVLRMPDHYLYRYGFSPDMSLRDMYEQTNCIELDNLQVRMLNWQPEYPPLKGSVDEAMFDVACENLWYIHDHGFVGVIERMPQFLRLLETELDWDASAMTRSNATKDRPAVDAIDPRAIELVREWNQFDLRLHELAEELFESRLADCSPKIQATEILGAEERE